MIFISRECLAEGITPKKKIIEYMEGTDGSLPFYFSVDKDVLCQGEAYTSWSQGDMTVDELLKMMEWIWDKKISQGGRILGIDICGESDSGEYSHSLVNDKTNGKLLAFLRKKEWQNEK